MSGIFSSQPASNIRRIPAWIRIVGIGLIIVMAAFAIVKLRPDATPQKAVSTVTNATTGNTINGHDVSTTVFSDHGSFQVTYIPLETPVQINQIETWKLRVTTPDGQPVENASITVDGGMPEHGHGLPTAPQVTKYLGDGIYQVEGMKFSMTGWWVLKFTIVQNNTSDNVTFNLVLS